MRRDVFWYGLLRQRYGMVGSVGMGYDGVRLAVIGLDEVRQFW